MRKPSRGGAIDLVDLGFVAGIAVFNLVNQIVQGKDIASRAGFTIPLFVMAAVFYWTPFKKQVKSMCFMLAGVASHVYSPNPSDFSAVIFFIMAYSEIENRKYGVFVVVTAFAVLAYKSAIVGDTIPQGFAMVAIFGYFFIRYYLKHFKDNQVKMNDKIKKLTKEQRKLMIMYGQMGMTRKEICAETGLTEDQLYNRYKEIRKIFGSDGKPAELVQVVYILASRGVNP